MERKMTVLVVAIGVLATACAATRPQVAAVPKEEPATYVDPWGTQVAWSQVPVASSGPAAPTTPADAEEAKPKVEEETPAPVPEPEPAQTTNDLGGDEDNDE